MSYYIPMPLQTPYSRDAWLALLHDLFGPAAALFARPAPIPDPAFAIVGGEP
jgi:hypothetical protein